MARGTVTYKPNHKGVAEYLRSPKVSHAVQSIAEGGKRYAESISPVETGAYASSWRVFPSSVKVGGRARVSAKLTNTSGHAAAVEYGYAGRAGAPGKSAHRVLGRTLEHMRGA